MSFNVFIGVVMSYNRYSHLYAFSLPIFSGSWSYTVCAGAFLFVVHISACGSNTFLGGRLIYL